MTEVRMNDPAFQANLQTWIEEARQVLLEQFGPATQYSVNWFPKPRVKLEKTVYGKTQTIVIEFRVERDDYDKSSAEYVFNTVYIGGVRNMIRSRIAPTKRPRRGKAQQTQTESTASPE